MQKITAVLKRILKSKWTKRIAIVSGLVLLSVFICDKWIVNSTKKQVYSELSEIPANEVGLVLGTCKMAKGGIINPFFRSRIIAAAELWKAGKIKHIIVSGDNHIKIYDEPSDMREALIAEGVPAACITMDYAGLRTFDSVVRCKKIFGQSKFTIISQQFHNERALFIANKTEGIEAVAFNAKEVPFRFHPMTFIREYAARVKCVLDIYLLNTEPKFLGKPEHIAVK
jgi:SanA protein